MTWIESHQTLLSHRKTLRAAALLQVDRYKLIGHLHALWWWASDNVPVNGSLQGLWDVEIAAAAGWDGDPTAFVRALASAGFIDEDAEGLQALHDWYGGHPSRKQHGAVRRAWEAMARRIRPLIFARDGYACQRCGDTDGPLEVDHVIAIAIGGTNDEDNLQTLCRFCNRSKGARS